MRLSILTPTPETAGTDEEMPSLAYSRNARGVPEFASVVITLDHLFNSDPLHVKQKMVYSTETAEEALASLFDYYGETSLLGLKSTRQILNELDSDPTHSIAIYLVPANMRDRKGGMIVQTVCSTAALHRLTNHPAFGDGSSLVAIDALTGFLARTFGRPGMTRLALIKLEDEPGEQA